MIPDPAEFGFRPAFLPYQDPTSQARRPAVRKRFFGKYRGSVADNVDPLGQGRLLVRVPDVFGDMTSTWALPCVPLAGPAMGAVFVPQPDTSVWVEFEQGDPQQPIWVGCFWPEPYTLGRLGQVAGMTATPAITLETRTAGVGISDDPDLGGNVIISAAERAVSITFDAAGVTITAPTVAIVTDEFTVNGEEFTVA
jgi:Type VI secretion system/phage-baseplate injector OB domain